MYSKYHEPKIEKIVNYKSRRIPITSEILQNVQRNRMMLLKILRILGLTKDEIFEFLKSPEMEIKEILFELEHGSKQEKKYCPNCTDLLIPTTMTKHFLYYYCQTCDKEYKL